MSMIKLSYLSAVLIKGNDAGDFLHNQVSSDILGLKPGESTLACYCEPKGRVLSLMLVSAQNDGYLVILAKTLSEAIIKRLRMYVLRAKVEIEVLENHDVAGLVSASSDDKVPESVYSQLQIPQSSLSYQVLEKGASPDSSTAEQDAWKHAELQNGISWLGTATSGEFLPQFLGFDDIGAVNYKKGCYPGQEIVARTHYLGKVKRHPRLICSESLIGPNQMEKVKIFSGDDSFDAVTVDFAFDENKGNCLLVVTRMDPELTAEKVEYLEQTVELVN